MPSGTRTTVYLKPRVHRALKVKTGITDQSMSDLINAAVSEYLRGDALDLETFDRRAKESTRPFENVLKKLRYGGTL